MDRRQIALKLVVSELGIGADMASFEERLILQKAIHLAQQAGIPLGYHYSWYLRGPYSRDLTADPFACSGRSLPDRWFLDASSRQKLEQVKLLINLLKSSADPVREFEKVSSVLFIIKTNQGSASDAAGITERTKKAGKDFNQEEVDGAVRILREHGLLSAA
jgi:uncharacterized protein YwgA